MPTFNEPRPVVLDTAWLGGLPPFAQGFDLCSAHRQDRLDALADALKEIYSGLYEDVVVFGEARVQFNPK